MFFPLVAENINVPIMELAYCYVCTYEDGLLADADI